MNDNNERYRVLNIRLPEELHIWLKIEGVKAGMTMTDIVFIALQLIKAEGKTPHDLIDALQEHERNPIH